MKQILLVLAIVLTSNSVGARQYQIAATSQISLDEEYSDEEVTRKPRVFLGYEVTKKIAIILRDVSKAEELLADIFKSGITRISDVEFPPRRLENIKTRPALWRSRPLRKRLWP